MNPRSGQIDSPRSDEDECFATWSEATLQLWGHFENFVNISSFGLIKSDNCQARGQNKTEKNKMQMQTLSLDIMSM